MSLKLCCLLLLLARAFASVDDIMTEASVNFFGGIIKGILGLEEPVSLQFELIPPCIVNGEQSVEIFDTSVANLTHINGLSNDDLASILQTLVLTLEKSMIPSMTNCGVNSSFIKSVDDALDSLNGNVSLSYTNITLEISGVEVYNEFASFMGSWALSNFHEAGYQFGVLARTVSQQNTSGSIACSVAEGDLPNTFNQQVSSMLASYLTSADEKVYIPLNIVDAWSWCNPQEENATVNICTNGKLGGAQFDTLNNLPLWQSDRIDGSYNDFLGEYQYFITSGPNWNTTEDEIIKRLQIQSNEIFHRAQRAMNATMPLYMAYKNNTQNPLPYSEWVVSVCTDPQCVAYVNDMAIVDKLWDELKGLYNSTNAAILVDAMDALQNTSFYCNYTSGGNTSVFLPCWTTSLLPNEWFDNYEKGMYQGGVAIDIKSDQSESVLCSGGLAEADPKFLGTLDLQLEINGRWHQIDMSSVDTQMNITYNAKSISRVDVTPGGWFQESALWRFRNYTQAQGDGHPSDYYFNPQTGRFNAMISGLLVASEVHFAFNSSHEFHSGVQSLFSTNNITGMKLGPFFATGITWSSSTYKISASFYNNLTVSDAKIPYIVGYIAKRLPYNPYSAPTHQGSPIAHNSKATVTIV